MTTRETNTNFRIVGDAAAEPIADESFDGIGFTEGHITRPQGIGEQCVGFV